MLRAEGHILFGLIETPGRKSKYPRVLREISFHDREYYSFLSDHGDHVGYSSTLEIANPRGLFENKHCLTEKKISSIRGALCIVQ